MAGNLAFGFAATNGGTSGGSGGRTVTVSTGDQLQRAIDSASGATTIVVQGKITDANTSGAQIVLDGKRDISIIGAASGGEFDGIGIQITGGSSNIIVQNLKIHHVRSGYKDAIGIQDGSRNIWIDNNELYSTLATSQDTYDGLLDIKRGAEYITVSDNYFHDHHKTSLVGYSDSDVGARYVTYSHNIFENIGSRAPSVRFGYTHIYENYYKDVSVSAINLRMGAVGLVENNNFVNVHNPVVSLDSTSVGFWDMRGNTFQNVTWGSFSLAHTHEPPSFIQPTSPVTCSPMSPGRPGCCVSSRRGWSQGSTEASTGKGTPSPSGGCNRAWSWPKTS